MTLLACCTDTWTQAACCGTRDAGQADARRAASPPAAASAATYAGRVRLSGNLLIATPAATGRQADLNKAKAMEAMNRRRRLVVVAPLAPVSSQDGRGAAPADCGFHCDPPSCAYARGLGRSATQVPYRGQRLDVWRTRRGDRPDRCSKLHRWIENAHKSATSP